MTELNWTKLNSIFNSISKAGGEVFYVGGCVRDEFIGHESKDIDVEIHGITVEDTEEILSKYGKVDKIGKSFGVLKLFGMDVDFSFPRTEKQTGRGHADFDVFVDPFISYENAAKRRDFTMNAIMKDANHDNIIVDPFNGIDDIENKVIKYVNRETFKEDALRPLRAAQFAARFGFTIDESVIEVAKTMDYTHLSKERVAVEIEKALMSNTPSIAFNYLREMGVIEQLFPFLHDLIGCPQNPVHHPEGDVWNHTMLVLDGAAQVRHSTETPIAFMYLALLHDIGKPATTARGPKGGWRAIHHDEVGTEMVPSAMAMITPEKKYTPYVKKMTEYHMYPHVLLNTRAYRVREIMYEVNMKELLLFNVCDKTGEDRDIVKAMLHTQYAEKVVLCTKLEVGGHLEMVPLIQGKDLIEVGLKPGPKFGPILEFARNLQFQGKDKAQIMKTLEKKTREGTWKKILKGANK